MKKGKSHKWNVFLVYSGMMPKKLKLFSLEFKHFRKGISIKNIIPVIHIKVHEKCGSICDFLSTSLHFIHLSSLISPSTFHSIQLHNCFIKHFANSFFRLYFKTQTIITLSWNSRLRFLIKKKCPSMEMLN